MVAGADGYTEKTFTLMLGAKDIFGDDAVTPNDDASDKKNEQEIEIPNGEYFDPFEFFWSMP